jgi:hypothetical protein
VLIIDRFEGDFALCEKQDRSTFLIRRTELPTEAREGDVIIRSDERYVVDRKATELRKTQVENAVRDLWE